MDRASLYASAARGIAEYHGVCRGGVCPNSPVRGFRCSSCGCLFCCEQCKAKNEHELARGLAKRVNARPLRAAVLAFMEWVTPVTVFILRLRRILAGGERACENPDCAAAAADARLKLCGCRSVWYCSRECQRAHWASHKPACSERLPFASRVWNTERV